MLEKTRGGERGLGGEEGGWVGFLPTRETRACRIQPESGRLANADYTAVWKLCVERLMYCWRCCVYVAPSMERLSGCGRWWVCVAPVSVPDDGAIVDNCGVAHVQEAGPVAGHDNHR